jgi:phospholipid-translocating ATPase
VIRSASGNHLTRRKFSTDLHGGRGGASGEYEMMAMARSSVPPKTRHSVDIAELLGRR